MTLFQRKQAFLYCSSFVQDCSFMLRAVTQPPVFIVLLCSFRESNQHFREIRLSTLLTCKQKAGGLDETDDGIQIYLNCLQGCFFAFVFVSHVLWLDKLHLNTNECPIYQVTIGNLFASAYLHFCKTVVPKFTNNKCQNNIFCI